MNTRADSDQSYGQVEHPRKVWVVTEFAGGGIRGVHESRDGAEANIAAICSYHPDLTRSDFVIHVERVRAFDVDGGQDKPSGTAQPSND